MSVSTKRIKVMHVAECIGGVDKYLHCLIKYMDHDKFDNVVVLSQLYKREDYEGLADHVEIMEMAHGVGPSALKSALNLHYLIKKNDPDIVYAHSSIAGAITRMACVGLKKKVIYNPHGWSFNIQSGKQKIFVALEKLMAPFCDVIVCISDAEKKSALEKGICREEKLHVIYNGIDIADYKEESAPIQIPENVFVVGMVGRICKQKAPDIFVKMAGLVKKEINNSFFIIVGDVIEGVGEEGKEIEDMARELGINLIITGWVDDPLSYVSLFDVGCLLSRWEGFGLAIPEYMLCEKPIVATKVDAIPYLIKDGENGLLVEKDDYESAAKAVVELYIDKKLRSRLVENGLNEVHERFDARRMSAECEELFGELVR